MNPAFAIALGIRQKIMAFFLVLAVSMVCVQGYLLAVPMYINYQGVVSDNGVVFNGSKNITFRFFDAEQPASGNNILGRDIVCYGVSIVDGVFNAEIGPFSSTDLSKMASENDLWAEVEINGEKFRQRFASAAFAFRAESAKKADTSASVDDNAITSLKVRDGEIKSADLAQDALAAGNISNIKITENITLNSGKKLYLDGGNGTYLAESAPNQISIFNSGKSMVEVLSNLVYVNSNIRPGGDNKYSLGDGVFRYRDVCSYVFNLPSCFESIKENVKKYEVGKAQLYDTLPYAIGEYNRKGSNVLEKSFLIDDSKIPHENFSYIYKDANEVDNINMNLLLGQISMAVRELNKRVKELEVKISNLENK